MVFLIVVVWLVLVCVVSFCISVMVCWFLILRFMVEGYWLVGRLFILDINSGSSVLW